VPNLLVEHAMRNPPVPPGFWRGVNINQNAIYLECFIDELAHAAGPGPAGVPAQADGRSSQEPGGAECGRREGRLGQAGRRRRAPRPRRGQDLRQPCRRLRRGLGGRGKVKVHRIVAATDPGYAVNPQQIEAQVEGSFVYGLSALFYGECTLKDGAVVQSNFHDYPPCCSDMPKVEVIVMPSGGFWGGIGEPTIAVAAPAVLNAIFARRLAWRSTPREPVIGIELRRATRLALRSSSTTVAPGRSSAS
jgi:isoquinoline 1-oxidoreductase beta subunit